MTAEADPFADLPQVTLLPPRAVNRTSPHPVTLNLEALAGNRISGFGAKNENSRPFFTMRSTMLRHLKASGHRVIAVTSVEPGNGKTHTALNLAAVISRITPTVLVELDLHRPSVGQRLGLPDDPPGVDDYLQGNASWNDTRIAIQGFDLTVHRVRKPQLNVEGLLNSPHLASAMARVRASDRRPVCIVDTPPALVSDDLALICRVVDGFMIVAQEARTRKRELLDLANTLSPTPIIGAVLNMAITDPIRNEPYGYYYEQARQPDG